MPDIRTMLASVSTAPGAHIDTAAAWAMAGRRRHRLIGASSIAAIVAVLVVGQLLRLPQQSTVDTASPRDVTPTPATGPGTTADNPACATNDAEPGEFKLVSSDPVVHAGGNFSVTITSDQGAGDMTGGPVFTLSCASPSLSYTLTAAYGGLPPTFTTGVSPAGDLVALPSTAPIQLRAPDALPTGKYSLCRVGSANGRSVTACGIVTIEADSTTSTTGPVAPTSEPITIPLGPTSTGKSTTSVLAQ